MIWGRIWVEINLCRLVTSSFYFIFKFDFINAKDNSIDQLICSIVFDK